MKPGSSVHLGKDVEGDRDVEQHLEYLFERLSDPEASSNKF